MLRRCVGLSDAEGRLSLGRRPVDILGETGDAVKVIDRRVPGLGGRELLWSCAKKDCTYQVWSSSPVPPSRRCPRHPLDKLKKVRGQG